MAFKAFFDSIINTGVKKSYTPWEVFLTRKLNSITFVGLSNMLIGIVFFAITGYYDFIIDCTILLCVGPIVFFFNKYKNYVWAAYAFYILGYLFFISVNLKMGWESYVILFYFPVLITLIQLLGRKELLLHLFILAILCLISIVIIAFGFKYNWLSLHLPSDVLANLRVFHAILSFCTAVIFVITVVKESLDQERLIKNMLTEKEVLLSEVFHRVKNNMNIITSLLSLKKNSSDQREVQDALEECRTRVFSMALVHQKIFERERVIDLNFKEYITELLKELMSSLGKNDQTDLVITADDVFIELSNAIPCGLILNEFVTNSFKYAQQPGKRLQIKIMLKKEGDLISLQLRDNGPGLPEDVVLKSNSLGMELMRSLSEQINGTYSFTKDNGLLFRLDFKQ